MSVIGIDFGNENCYVAAVRSGGIEILSTDTGQRMIPSYIGFGETVRSFGTVAKSAQVVNIQNTVYGFKHLIGRRFCEEFVRNETTYLPYTICEMKNGFLGVKVKYHGKDTKFYIEQLTAMLLSKLKEVAEKDLRAPISNCVIAVPSYFNDLARRSMLDAARIAGLNVLRLINEHAAVALSYGFYKDITSKKPIVVFVDLGHSCLQVSVCEITNKNVKVLSTVSDIEVGGRDFDNSIVRYFAEYFSKKYDLNVLSNERAIIRLMSECEKLKKQLSANPQSMPLHLECFMNKDVSGTLNREKMEELCEDLLLKTERTMRRALAESKKHFSDISDVELVGGSSRIPAIRNLVQKVFRCEPSTTLNLDEAVAKGCALQGAIYSPTVQVKEFDVQDIQPYPIRLVWTITGGEPGEMEVFPKNHPIPHSKYLTYFRSEDFVLKAYYGEPNETPSNKNFIGAFIIRGTMRSRSGESSRVQITVRIDINGIFSIHSATIVHPDASCNEAADQEAENNRDVKRAMGVTTNNDVNKQGQQGGLTVQVEIPSLSDKEIEKFISDEAIMKEHENSEEERVNAKNNLEEYLYEIRSSLEDDYSEYISEKERNEFMAQLQQVEMWLYEGGQDQCKDIYVKEHERLKSIISPVLFRKELFKNITDALDGLSEAIQRAETFLNEYERNIGSYPQIDHRIFDRLWNETEKKKAFLTSWRHAIQEARKCSKPPIDPKSIIKETETLSNNLASIMNIQPEANKHGPTPTSGSGHYKK